MSRDGEEWGRVSEVFLAVLEETPERRAALLTELTGGDRALAREVEELLDAHFGHGHFDRLSDGVGLSSLHDTASAAEGARVGPYELLEEIGRGGMGTVFRARRADGQFDQEVALKLHHSDVYRSELRERFLAERQILARIAHPHIARLLDGGVTEDGQSYFAMEYVDGQPIDVYCDARRLSVRERLELFRVVCGAVDHAHRNLVVHRDLKPRNVLVTSDGEVKLLDFGIAKLLDAGGASTATYVTQVGARMLTPDYAAPEQIRGDAVTTSTDVYQLGVLLYEILAGVRPHTLHDASLLELERVVLRGEPEPVSKATTRVEEGAPTPDHRAGQRSTEPDRLSRELRGDLDAIVGTALRREPEDRYSSAAAVSVEIERHLTGHPVRARASSRWYRTRRFVGRNRVGVAAAAAALLAGSVFAVDRSRQVRATRTALAESEQVTDFLVSVFQSSSPELMNGDAVTLRDVLDAGADRVRSELAEEPVVQARLMSLIAEVYEHLGVYEPALELRRDALATREASLPAGHPDIVWAAVQLATQIAARGDAAEARARLIAAEEALKGGRVAEVDRALRLNDLGYGWQVLGDHERARRLYEASIGAYRQVEPEEPARASPLINLGHLLLAASEADSAEALFVEALAIRRSLFDERTVVVANAVLSLARAVQAKGDLVRADSLLGEVARIREAIYPEGHPLLHTLSVQRAALLVAMDRSEEAALLYRDAVAGLSAQLGPGDGELALARNDWGSVLNRLERFEEAERPLRAALPVFVERYGVAHAFSQIVRNNLAVALSGGERFDEAEALFRQALEESRSMGGPGDDSVQTLTDWAQVRVRRGDLAGAVSLFEEAVPLLIAARGEADSETQRTRNRLGAVLVALERYEDAEAVLLAAYAAAPDETRSFTSQELVELYDAWGRPDEAGRYRDG